MGAIIYRHCFIYSFFNIGGGAKNKISLKNLTIKCERITRNKIPISKNKKTSLFDVPYFVTDNSKIYKFYKWKPLHSIDILLNDIYMWLKENKSLKKFF